jgi:hypothetical protein
MTFVEFNGFLQSVVPSHAEVDVGEDDMIRVRDHTADADVYIKYEEGLDFSLQGVHDGEKGEVRKFKFKNEQEMLAILVPKVLELLDGERRI